MSDENSLTVFHEDSVVGRIWRDEHGRMGFVYENQWLQNGFAISQQLPLKIAEYSPNEGLAQQFFANLLPEADARLHIVKDLKLSNSDFSLLKALGGDCAGALSILPDGYRPDDEAGYRQLSENDVKDIIKRRGRVSSFATFDELPRLSLAGAQDKCPVWFDDGKYYVPQQSSPSSHILKFEVTDYRNIPVYECFLTMLAASIDLPVVDMELKTFGTNHFLLIKRYDRVLTDNNQVKRLHQEDFCQALGVSHERKYQQEGGPSFQDCYQLVKHVSTDPIRDNENLLKWQIFNVLAGNSDGHAKNLALVYHQHQQVRLAPFYDLVCTRAVERINPALAMSIGDEFNPEQLMPKHWQALAEQCNVQQQYFSKLIIDTAKLLQKNITTVIAEFEKNYGHYPALQCIRQVVNKQCKRTLKLTTS